MGNGFLVFFVVFLTLNQISSASDVFILNHNYSCVYNKYTVMECIPGPEIQSINFEAPVLVEPVGSNDWWLNFGIIIGLVLFSGTEK